MIVIGAMAVTSSAYAFTPGELDGQWANTRITTTVKKNHSIDKTATPHTLNGENIKFDSGKDTCFSALHYNGSSSYTMENICNVSGTWRSVSYQSLDELSDGSLGDEWADFDLPQAGSSDAYSHHAYYEGTLVILVQHKKDGTVKSGKVVNPEDGMIEYHNHNTDVEGTARSGLKIKPVDISKVPQGAIDCYEDIYAVSPSIPGCGL